MRRKDQRDGHTRLWRSGRAWQASEEVLGGNRRGCRVGSRMLHFQTPWQASSLYPKPCQSAAAACFEIPRPFPSRSFPPHPLILPATQSQTPALSDLSGDPPAPTLHACSALHTKPCTDAGVRVETYADSTLRARHKTSSLFRRPSRSLSLSPTSRFLTLACSCPALHAPRPHDLASFWPFRRLGAVYIVVPNGKLSRRWGMGRHGGPKPAAMPLQACTGVRR